MLVISNSCSAHFLERRSIAVALRYISDPITVEGMGRIECSTLSIGYRLMFCAVKTRLFKQLPYIHVPSGLSLTFTTLLVNLADDDRRHLSFFFPENKL